MAKSISACDFPYFNNLNKIPQNENLFRIHINLSKKVQNPPTNTSGTLKNLFACCFVFYFKDSSIKTLYIQNIFISCDPFWDGNKYPCSATIKNLIFKCVTKIPNNENIKYLTYLYGGKESPQPISREPLILSLKKIYESRNSASVQDPTKITVSAKAVRVTDGETQSIHTISNEDFLQKNLIDKLPKDKKIVAIEFHGCTTFDMCPFCFANMNMVQFLANHNIDAGFLGLLKSLLGNQKLLATPDDIPTTIIISSCRNGGYFHNEQYGWKSDNIMTKKVNQFRIDDNVISPQKLQTINQIPIKTGRPNQMKKQKKAKKTNSFTSSIMYWQYPFTLPGYQLINVSGSNNNCGVRALLTAINGEDTADEETIKQERQKALQAFNTYIKKHTDHNKSQQTIEQTRNRIANSGQMLTTEDFQWFASSLNRSIAIVVQGPNGEISYRHFSNTGDITDPNDIPNQDAFFNLIRLQPDTIVIYHSGIHFQALVPNRE